MRVLLQARRDLHTVSGGDTVHIRQLLRHLGTLGVDARLSLELAPDLHGVDIVHLFNAVRVNEAFIQWSNAERNRVAAVCTPIYVPRTRIRRYEEQGWSGTTGLRHRLIPSFEVRQQVKSWVREKDLGGSGLLSRLRVSYREKQRRLLSGVARVLVDTELEARAIERDLQIEGGRFHRIPLSGEIRTMNELDTPKRRACRPSSVLCPARIEPLKNQLALIDALSETDLHACFCGPRNHRHEAYCRRFDQSVRASPRARYLGPIPWRDMPKLYDAAAVVALPSWLEATGLAALEGAERGRPVVVTRESYAMEYLGERAQYCDPGDVASIRASVLEALRMPATPAGLARTCSTWKAHADRTIAIYEEVLAERR